MSSSPAHLVIIPLASWGHLRPEVHFGLTLLESNPDLVVTFLPDRRGAKRIEQELSSYPSLAQKLSARFKILPGVEMGGRDIPDDEQDAISEECKANIGRVLAGVLDGTMSFHVKPSVVAVDLFRGQEYSIIVKDVAKEHGVKHKYLTIFPCLTSPTTRLLDHGKASYEARLAGNTAEAEKIDAQFCDLTTMVYSPDLPPTTTAQFFPQLGSSHFSQKFSIDLINFLVPHLLTSDGVITVGVDELEPTSQAHLASMAGIPVYPIGYSPREAGGVEEIPPVMNHPRYPTDDGRVKAFLERYLAEKGEKSVVYVSFGTLAFPNGREDIVDWLFTSILEETDYGIVLALAAEKAELPEELEQRVMKTGRMVMASWIPQKLVLHHPATSFFISHVGAGSMFEGIMAGLPIVTVPQFADQSLSAALLEVKGVGRQLFQLCTGLDGVTFTNGVVIRGTEEAAKEEMKALWSDLKGPKGDEMRTKMRDLRDVLVKSYEVGESRKNIERVGRVISGIDEQQ